MNLAALKRLFSRERRSVYDRRGASYTRARTHAAWLTAAWAIFALGAALQPYCKAFAEPLQMPSMTAVQDHGGLHIPLGSHESEETHCPELTASGSGPPEAAPVFFRPLDVDGPATHVRSTAAIHIASIYAVLQPANRLYLRTARLLI